MGEPLAAILSGPRRGLFFPEAARGTASVLLVEGRQDALALYQAGLRNVMALGGRVLSEEVRHLVREQVEEVFLCLDADEAGDRGALEAAERLAREKIRSRRVELPIKDPAEFFLSRAHADFRKLLQEAAPLGVVREEALVLSGDETLELMLTEGEFLYRARLLTAPSSGKLKALLRVEGPRGRCHRDTLDLYSHKARKMFSNRAAERFEGLTPGCVEAQLERLIDQAEALSSRSGESQQPPDTSMTGSEREEALAFLRRPDLKEAIPYAGALEFPSHYLRTRRDHERFLSLIEVAAFLHQHQRARKTRTVRGKAFVYLEATFADCRIAYALAHRVLRVSLDELTRWSRELYERLETRAGEAEAQGGGGGELHRPADPGGGRVWLSFDEPGGSERS